MSSFVEILTLTYLLLFSVYHIITGVVSVFFPNFALKFYKTIYGFHPKETEQLKMTLRPWGNFAIMTGVTGFIVLFNLEKFFLFLLPFSLLLLIRIWYRLTLRKQLYKELKVKSIQNWRMIIIQLIGAILFAWFAISMF
jgi:hypothetical protein